MSSNTFVKAQKEVINDAIKELVDSSVFLGITSYTSIKPTSLDINEGATINFNVLSTTDDTYYYWVEGVTGTVDSADFSSGWADSSSRGTVSITDGVGIISLTLAGDASVDGTETFRVKLSRGSTGAELAQSALVTINDTSLPFGGTNYGYSSGGGTPGSNYSDVDRFSFVSPGNAVDVGNLSPVPFTPDAQNNKIGQNSSTYAYQYGGGGNHNRLDAFPFSSAYGSNIGQTSGTFQRLGAGQSSSSHGYATGYLPSTNNITKFPFSVTPAIATDVASLSYPRYATSGQTSATHGYTTGGYPPPSDPSPGSTDVIDKFPFASDTNATDVGNLTQKAQSGSGQSSPTHGYISGGRGVYVPPTSPFLNNIQKFPFASDTNATDIANLAIALETGSGQSSLENGYNSGGITAPGAATNRIDKFPFTSDTNSVYQGALVRSAGKMVGNHY